MVDILTKQLLEAGVHFGHQTKRWNPKMRRYIFGEKNGIYIIDLEQTAKCIIRACDFLRDIAASGEYILFVGTKKQAQEIVASCATRCGMFYVNNRWLGGMLTNFATIKKSIKRLKDIMKMKEDGTFELLTKKETVGLEKEAAKLKNNLGGIMEMGKLPKALFVIDSKREEITVAEANKLNIPVVGIVDTNCDPDKVIYTVPANDDAIRSINLIAGIVTDAIEEGRKKFNKGEAARLEKEKAEEVVEVASSDLPDEDEPKKKPASKSAGKAGEGGHKRKRKTVKSGKKR